MRSNVDDYVKEITKIVNCATDKDIDIIIVIYTILSEYREEKAKQL